MGNYILLENNTIKNVIVVDDDIANNDNLIPVEEGFGIGDKYENGQFIKTIISIPPTWNDIIFRRNRSLIESDTYVLPDRWTTMTPEKQQEWATYRQTLRDIPQTFTNPDDVVWPARPE